MLLAEQGIREKNSLASGMMIRPGLKRSCLHWSLKDLSSGITIGFSCREDPDFREKYILKLFTF
jgi:hypothetical protein